MDAATSLSPATVRRLYRQARAERWSLAEDAFADALRRSVSHRFKDEPAAAGALESYLGSLHLEDLALATACATGAAAAWDHFVLEFRPVLYRTAEALRVPGDARELADSIYAELFGLDERDGVRRSLLRYYHGRASLAGWLRSVLAQRAVDRARSARRTVSLDDDDGIRGDGAGRLPARPVRDDGDAADPHRATYLSAIRAALGAAIAALLPRDRLRLALYYARGVKLAQIGRVLGESEATASRKLDRTRRDLRADVARRLGAERGMNAQQVALAFEYVVADEAFDLREVLPAPDS